jgi:hypothetical protein
MAITVVLAVGWDPWLLAAQNSSWRAAGYFTVSASSISEAFRQFETGDFDLVLLGSAISRAKQKSLTRQIRETGARAPVIDAADFPDDVALFKKAVSKIAANPRSVSSTKLPETQEPNGPFVVLSAG